MLRRNFDVSPAVRRLQASVLIAFACGAMALAFHAGSRPPDTHQITAGRTIVASP